MTLMHLGSSILYNDVRANKKIEKKPWKLLITNGLLKYLYIYIFVGSASFQIWNSLPVIMW